MNLSSRLSFHRELPLFGLDIGHSSLKIMQLQRQAGKKPKVLGYGVSNYYPQSAITNGVIVNFEVLAHTMRELFSDRLIGNITSKRVACSVPTSHTFSRPMTLPPMDKQQIEEAVKTGGGAIYFRFPCLTCTLTTKRSKRVRSAMRCSWWRRRGRSWTATSSYLSCSDWKWRTSNRVCRR